jgi:hypothetical protein
LDFLAFDGDVERTLTVDMRAELAMLGFFGEGGRSVNMFNISFLRVETRLLHFSSLAGAAKYRAGKARRRALIERRCHEWAALAR